jgi:N6-adenosine-specific RNA methylase IME4
VRFKTAIIDPPWPYTVSPGTDDATRKGLSGFVRNKDGDHEYAVLSIEKLRELPVGELVDGYLLMWATMPFLPDAISLFGSWGFEYKTGMCWGKWDLNRSSLALFDDHDFNSPGNGGYGGVGYWFLGNHELVLLGKKPDVPSIRTKRSSLFLYPKTKHSEKPNHLHELCEECFPGPYVELFGRRKRDGWTILGNEAPGDGEDIFVSIKRELARNPEGESPENRPDGVESLPEA